jgi:ATP-dependent Zn protease
MRYGRRLRVLASSLALALCIVGCSSSQARMVGWGEFLHNVSLGQVAKVVQQDTTLTITATDGSTYAVTAPGFPGVNADYLKDVRAAAAEGGTTFDARNYSVEPTPNNSWVGLVITGLVPLVVIVGFILLAMRQVSKRKPDPAPPAALSSSPADRLRRLEDARDSRLITDEEYAAKRAQILDEF